MIAIPDSEQFIWKRGEILNNSPYISFMKKYVFCILAMLFAEVAVGQDSSCISTCHSLFRQMKDDSTSKGSLTAFNTAYFNRLLPYVNRPVLVQLMAVDTIFYDTATKLDVFFWSLAFMDIMIDEAGFDKLQLKDMVVTSKERKELGEEMGIEQPGLISITVNYKGQDIELGLFLMDKECRLIGFVSGNITPEGGKLLLEVKRKRRVDL